MAVTVTAICAVILLIVLVLLNRRSRARHEIDRYSITPEDLHALFASNEDVLLFDVRLPLDLLTSPEIIPGAKRLAAATGARVVGAAPFVAAGELFRATVAIGGRPDAVGIAVQVDGRHRDCRLRLQPGLYVQQ